MCKFATSHSSGAAFGLRKEDCKRVDERQESVVGLQVQSES